MYERKIKHKIGMFIGKNKTNFIDIYDEIDFTLSEDFSEIIEKYCVYPEILENDFKNFRIKSICMSILFLNKKIVEYCDKVIKNKIMRELIWNKLF